MGDKENSKKRQARKSRITDDQIKRALSKTNGLQSEVARILEVSRSVISDRIKANVDLQAHCKQLIEDRIDRAESCLDKLLREGNITACLFTLKTIGRTRGYIEHAPLEDVDSGKLKLLGEFFQSIGARFQPSSKPTLEAPIDPDLSREQTSDQGTTELKRRSHFP